MSLNRTIYRVILILSFIILNGLILLGVSSILAYLNTGADRANMLHTELKTQNVYVPYINWKNLDNPGRPISEEELKSIESDYLKSWYVKNIAFKTNNPYGLDDFYTEDSRTNIYDIINLNKEKNITIEATTVNHQPNLEFYSEDGKLVVINDQNVVEFKNVFKDSQLVLSKSDTSAYRVILLLEDGFWRVRHKVKIPNQKELDTIKSNPFASVEGSTILVENKPFIIKGINYYPQETPWDMFGDNFNITTIEKDFSIIKNANLNSIRIFIQFEDFGKTTIKSEKLEKLKTVLDLAEKIDLKVIVTLFDFYGDYSLMDWTLTNRHAERIVSEFKNHKAILAWDIKNEPDLDFETRNKATVLAWLSQMAKEIKKFDPNHLITIGWASPEAGINLIDDVDFISYHYYKNIDYFLNDFKILKSNTQNKPLVLQEFGISSYGGIWNLFGSSKKKQAIYHKKMQAILKKDSLAFMSWGLYDFKTIPTSVVGSLPWRKSKQKYFGFIDNSGNQKPAFLYITY